MYTYVPSFLDRPPPQFPHSRSPQITELSSLHYIPGSHQLSILHMVVYVCQTQSSIHPTIPFPNPHVHLTGLSVCLSIPALQIGSSVPFFQIPYICINIQYLRQGILKKIFNCIYLFGRTSQHVGTQFSGQGLHLCPLQWKQVILTTGPPGKFPKQYIFYRLCIKLFLVLTQYLEH